MTLRIVLTISIAFSCCRWSSAQESNVHKVVELAKDTLYESRIYQNTRPKEMKKLLERVLLKLKRVRLTKDQQHYVVQIQERITVLDRVIRDQEAKIIEEFEDIRQRRKAPRRPKWLWPKEDGMPELFRDLCLLAEAQAAGREEQNCETLGGCLQQLKSSDRELRRQAAENLGKLGVEAKQAVPALTSVLRDPAEEVRLAALGSLSSFGPGAKQAIPEIVGLFRDQGLGKVSLAAQRTLGQLGAVARSAIPSLVEPLTVPAEYGLSARQMAPMILLKIDAHDPRVREALTRALRDQDGIVRVNAAFVLWSIGERKREAKRTLIRSLSSKLSDVKESGLGRLSLLGPDARKAVPVILRLFKDTDARIRSSAIGTISAIGHINEVVLQALIASLHDKAPTVQECSAYALGQLGGRAKNAVPALLVLAKGESDGPAIEASYALWRIDASPPHRDLAVNVLVRSLKGRSAFTREDSARKLGTMKASGTSALPALQVLLNDESHDVRSAASEAINSIKN